MSERDDGGPAFPQSRVWNAARAEYEDTQQYPGMSLRDWFAGTVDISSTEFPSVKEMVAFVGPPAPEADDFAALIALSARVNAKLRYALADAMLAERAKARGES